MAFQYSDLNSDLQFLAKHQVIGCISLLGLKFTVNKIILMVYLDEIMKNPQKYRYAKQFLKTR